MDIETGTQDATIPGRNRLGYSAATHPARSAGYNPPGGAADRRYEQMPGMEGETRVHWGRLLFKAGAGVLAIVLLVLAWWA
ncbi:MAG TPA: hypothetical protein VEW94_13335, partial [Chloroflexia bacterium]|nr:hypothetical protein [Chloroflexia bacterium]